MCHVSSGLYSDPLMPVCAAIKGLQDLYKQLTEALPPHSSDRRLNKAVPPGQRVNQVRNVKYQTEHDVMNRPRLTLVAKRARYLYPC